MNPLRHAAPPDSASTRDRVVDHVRRLIEDRELGPGDRLPGERDLALELGLSRPSVRSGLEALQAMGHSLKEGRRRWGNMQAVYVDRRSGEARGYSDPRGMGGGF